MSLTDAVLPHSLAAERAVLGAILRSVDVLADVRDLVAPEDYYRDAHATLYRRMLALADAGRPVDLVGLLGVLERHAEVEAVGGARYIAALLDDAPRPSLALGHAEEVRAYALRRAYIRIGQQLQQAAREADDIEEPRADAEAALRACQTGSRSALVDAEAAVAGALDILESYERAEHVGVTGVATGLYSLDVILGGWQPEDLIVIAARPSVGKTAFAGQVAAYAAMTRRVPVLFATLEQPPDRLSLRMAGNHARVDIEAARKRQIRDEELERLGASLRAVGDAPLTFFDARGKRMSDIRRHARMLHAQGRCALLVIDYLGLVQPETARSKGETRERQVAVQSEAAKNIARELRIPVLLLCQLNREYERDQPKPGARKAQPRRPRLSDLRESGAVEQDADVVLFVHRPYARPQTIEEQQREGETELIVAKHRNGALGVVDAFYAKTWVRFEEAT